MDAKEKKDRADQTARRVYDILKNHDQEMSTIEAQIDAERAALEEDLEAIRARAYPRGVRYDTPRVQSSPDPDGLLVKVADAIQRRTARTKRATDALEERQRQIENVHEAILTMDAKSKIILLTHYEDSPGALLADVVLLCGAQESPLDSGSIPIKVAVLYVGEVLLLRYMLDDPEHTNEAQDRTSEAVAIKLI